MSSQSGRRGSLLGLGVFWVVVLLLCLTGVWAVQALGLQGSKAVSHAAVVHRPQHARSRSLPALSLSSIFSAQPPSLRGYDPKKLRTLIATGDVIPARSVNYKMVTYNDFLYPWRRTASYIRSGDLTLINLESPLINGCPVTDQGMSFCGDPRAIQGLQYAGVDVACTANNHIGNYGSAGIQETWAHLRAAHIGFCGLGSVDYETVRGLTFAFLAFNCVGERFDYAEARREIRAARKTADVVVVSVHWGKEYVPIPETEPGIADDNPRQVGHFIIDSGADLVIGNHPHHIQGVEFYHGRLITFAHGNFIFDQMFTPADCPGSVNFLCSTREGVVGAYTFYGRRLVAVRYRPVVIYDYSQPRWATPAEARTILAEMKQSSVTLARMDHTKTGI